MEGFVTKRSRGKNRYHNMNWKVRWLKLEGNLLTYYKDPLKKVKKGGVKLSQHSMVLSHPDVGSYTHVILVKVSVDTKNDLVFSADSAESRLNWMKKIVDAINCSPAVVNNNSDDGSGDDDIDEDGERRKKPFSFKRSGLDAVLGRFKVSSNKKSNKKKSGGTNRESTATSFESGSDTDEEEVVAKVPMIAVSEHAHYQKYFKMVQMGLPVMAAKNKMMLDKIDPAVLDLDPQSQIPIDEAVRVYEGANSRPNFLQLGNALKPQVRKKKLFLKAVRQSMIGENSLWSEANGSDDIDVDEEEFARFFVEKLNTGGRGGGAMSKNATAAAAKKKEKIACIIDSKRAQNSSIALARIRIPFIELRDKLVAMDDDGLNLAQLQSLKEFLPQPEEVQALRKYAARPSATAATLAQAAAAATAATTSAIIQPTATSTATVTAVAASDRSDASGLTAAPPAASAIAAAAAARMGISSQSKTQETAASEARDSAATDTAVTDAAARSTANRRSSSRMSRRAPPPPPADTRTADESATADLHQRRRVPPPPPTDDSAATTAAVVASEAVVSSAATLDSDVAGTSSSTAVTANATGSAPSFAAAAAAAASLRLKKAESKQQESTQPLKQATATDAAATTTAATVATAVTTTMARAPARRSSVMELEQKVGGLGAGERFMFAMLTLKGDVDLVGVARRLDCMIYKQKFEHNWKECRLQMQQLCRACDDIKQCAKLKKVLRTVLKVANQLNDGGEQAGFTLEALCQLQNSKTFDQKTTVLQYIVMIVGRNDPEALKFPEEILPSVRAAARLTMDTIEEEKVNLQVGLQVHTPLIEAMGQKLQAEAERLLQEQERIRAAKVVKRQQRVQRYRELLERRQMLREDSSSYHFSGFLEAEGSNDSEEEEEDELSDSDVDREGEESADSDDEAEEGDATTATPFTAAATATTTIAATAASSEACDVASGDNLATIVEAEEDGGNVSGEDDAEVEANAIDVADAEADADAALEEAQMDEQLESNEEYQSLLACIEEVQGAIEVDTDPKRNNNNPSSSSSCSNEAAAVAVAVKQPEILELPAIGSMTVYDFFASEAASSRCEELEQCYQLTKSKFAGIVAYFGEDKDMPCQELFTNLSRFIQDFVIARDLIERLKKAELRRKLVIGKKK